MRETVEEGGAESAASAPPLAAVPGPARCGPPGPAQPRCGSGLWRRWGPRSSRCGWPVSGFGRRSKWRSACPASTSSTPSSTPTTIPAKAGCASGSRSSSGFWVRARGWPAPRDGSAGGDECQGAGSRAQAGVVCVSVCQ